MSVITPSLLLDHLRCVHKVWRDKYGPRNEFVDEANPFLKLLWDRGIQHEAEIIAGFGFDYVDCGQGSEAERIAQTNDALAARAEYIYQGVLAHGNLFGIPDLLHFIGGEYVPIEIKSGSAAEGGDEMSDGKPKKEYGVQLALYADLLNRKGLNSSRRAFVIDITGDRIAYDLNAPMGARTPETMWELYLRVREDVESTLRDDLRTDPAMCGSCKDCGWYASCKAWAKENDDLTQVFYVGRTVRDTIRRDLESGKIDDLLAKNADSIIERKKSDKSFLKGIGESTLSKIIARGRLMKTNGEPVIYEKFDFPEVSTELFFDIETDPTQDFVYLHGFLVRDRDGERFVEFTATKTTREMEREFWKRSIDFIRSFDPADVAVYYYSAYEKSTYRRLQKKYPDVISEADLETMFAHPNVIDLYAIVTKMTDWPLGSYGIKAIAQYLKFKWRDETPSGALSIQWYNDYLKSSEKALLNRVLEYNEDDCKATLVVKDYLKQRMDAM
jgi:uncharacterized protein